MKAMAECPHDAVAESKAKVLEFLIKKNIEGKNLTVFDVVSYLPAYRSPWMQKTKCLGNSRGLLLDI